MFGSVLAERIATVLERPVDVYETRGHAGGNCHSFIDDESGIECHTYGSHIFHTNLPDVWKYINKFTAFNTYRHKVLTKHNGKTWQMPINLATFNDLYKKDLGPAEARRFLTAEIAACNINKPTNLEEKAISLIGRPLYEAFIQNYTTKQWGREPKELPADIITRLPVRYNYNAEYFDDFWQGLPLAGYHGLFKKMLSHPLITLHLNSEYKVPIEKMPSETIIIYSGMPDKLFDYYFGKLEWRSLDFKWESKDVQDYQGTSVMNYADLDQRHTRIHEFKHYHPERKTAFENNKTIICTEYPAAHKPGREVYYPINDKRNNELYALYQKEAAQIPGLILGGRLGSYKYWDMDKTIAYALEVFKKISCGN